MAGRIIGIKWGGFGRGPNHHVGATWPESAANRQHQDAANCITFAKMAALHGCARKIKAQPTYWFSWAFKWCRRKDSNPRPAHYESGRRDANDLFQRGKIRLFKLCELNCENSRLPHYADRSGNAIATKRKLWRLSAQQKCAGRSALSGAAQPYGWRSPILVRWMVPLPGRLTRNSKVPPAASTNRRSVER